MEFSDRADPGGCDRFMVTFVFLLFMFAVPSLQTAPKGIFFFFANKLPIQTKRGIAPNFQDSYVMKSEHSHSDWFDVKCSLLEKLTESEFTVVVIGTICLKRFMPL